MTVLTLVGRWKQGPGQPSEFSTVETEPTGSAGRTAAGARSYSNPIQ
jgi:hypothetical protein